MSIEHRKFDRRRAAELLSALGRDAAFLEKKVADLSGGEIQITALVRALQLDPTVLLLDEPTAALDGPTATAVEQLIDRWLTESGQRAMIWVSHNEAQAQRVGRTAIRMEAGRLTVLLTLHREEEHQHGWHAPCLIMAVIRSDRLVRSAERDEYEGVKTSCNNPSNLPPGNCPWPFR